MMSGPSLAPRAEASTMNRSIRALLVSTPMMRLKRTLRNAAWAVRGRRLRSPPWPSPVHSVLFVCYGNICRSPFAAHLTGKLLSETGRSGVRAESAGFRTSQNATSPPEAVGAAASYGVDLEGHRPTLLTPELIRASDVVFVMEPSQLDTLLPLFEPGGEAFGAYEQCHLVDPFGKGDAEFVRCYARIARTITWIVQEWTQPVRR
jgi:protein-tyrosine phosphatase